LTHYYTFILDSNCLIFIINAAITAIGSILFGKFEILNDATIKIVISSDETETLDCGKYRYNLIMTNLETGEKYNILQGLLFLLDVVEE
jgi:hypothetical protein